MRKFASVKDLFPIIMLLAVAAVAFVLMQKGGRGEYAEVVRDNTVVKRLSLAEDATYSPIDGVEIEVKNGKAAFAESDCPDKICVNTGFIGNTGQSAVCLPNRLTLRIVGSDDSDNGVDAYVG
jgi:hypothetical protein